MPTPPRYLVQVVFHRVEPGGEEQWLASLPGELREKLGRAG